MIRRKEKEKGRPRDFSATGCEDHQNRRELESSFILCIQEYAQYHFPKDQGGRIRFNIMSKYYFYYTSS